ncbi:MAG: dehydrogenase [Gimesia sp.]|uniref:PVC-type heme-binding CxxCH protein n=3 Tax=Gimesia TaxID=1649453 RepID=UPI000C44A4FE|nr:PVC-type heme-binding CxxCH protein [Gimesia sp.]MAX36176.1 dehydrogenase [Gimesia sp.]|tara:strand:+ start:7210 stop:10281 length:3072 start_codon:yes stop_codon:yes gene_type:complete
MGTGRGKRGEICLLLILLAGMGFSLPRINSAEEPAKPADSLAKALPKLDPVSPERAEQTFRLRNGFQMELLAAEPLVTDPVAMQYDENGLAYVIEMNDYPYTDKSKDEAWAEQKSAPIGKIRILEDVDGDGKFDRSTVFAEELSWPTGLAFWKGGVYVSATPDIWYFKDTDGDHKADIRRKVFTGFRKFNVQAVMNNLKWGLDHHIYGAGGSNGGVIHSNTAEKTDPINMGRRDFRFTAGTEKFDVISGGARFGNTFDDWGNRFICNIRNPLMHIVLPTEYLMRNRYLPVTSAINDVAVAGDSIAVYRASPPEPWRVINAKRLASDPNSRSPRSEQHATGFVTSSAGATVYRGTAYPPEYYGNAFIGEVAGNLVMRYLMQPDGVTFTARRAHDKVEFLASTDNWFRPVNFLNAPDGTLHVLDMYRENIEHPWSIPDDIKAHLDLTSGRDRGRIYRLVPPEFPTDYQKPAPPRLGSASIKTLVSELENPNVWWRDTAHRLIFERQDPAAVPLLKQLFQQSASPLARLHALWSLEGLKVLTDDTLLQALADSEPEIRRTAIRLAEKRMNQNEKLQIKILALAADSDPRVRFQAAFTLGEMNNPQAADALYQIARRDLDDVWIRTAVLSSLSETTAPFLKNMLADEEFAGSPAAKPLLSQLSNVIGTRQQLPEVKQILELTASYESPGQPQVSAALQDTVILAIGQGLKRSGKTLLIFPADDQGQAAEMLRRRIANARQTAADRSQPLEVRQQAIELLSCTDLMQAEASLISLLDAREPQAIQTAVVAALTSFSDTKIAELLLERYPSLTPSVRTEIVNQLLRRQNWILRLFAAIADRTVSIAQIPQVRRTILMKSPNPEIKQQAEKLFAGDTLGPRREIIAAYQPALDLKTDLAAGKVIFKRECLTCHKLGKEGYEVGPNLATIKNRTASEILVHVLDPNKEVSPNYLEYVVVTDVGLIETGIIVNETPSSITLKKAENKEITILRENIEEIRSSGKSLMPEGFEKKIKTREMADLIAYLMALEN